MRAVGLITEYNPFHNGHLHHLLESKRVTGADIAVAVMSGHFLQRGEPALLDKWTRAEMALAAGVDLVVELPLPWACASAPDFARGGVQALSLLGGVATLCFGSEAGDLSPLQQRALTELEYETLIAGETAALLRQGLSWPAARARVLKRIGLAPDEFSEPNNILAIEYLKALATTRVALTPFTIERIGAGYHDLQGQGAIASASAVRLMVQNGEDVTSYLPQRVGELLQGRLDRGHVCSVDQYLRLVLGAVFQNHDSLERNWLVEQGIARRIFAAADTADSFETLVDSVKSRHLTRTRVQRTLLSAVLGIEKQLAGQLLDNPPGYLHLLAASPAGQRFLGETRKLRQLPLIQNFSRVIATLKRFYGAESAAYRRAHQQLELELKATRIYSLTQAVPMAGSRCRDYYQPFVQG